MALVDAGMPCALCHAPIDDPIRDTFAMTMWGIEDNRFAMLDDAACHQACIDRWEHRDAFLAYYNRNCRDELYVDRNGHVSYRFDYAHWIGNATVMTLAILFCTPPLVLLEIKWRTPIARFIAFTSPYLILAGIVVLYAIKWSFLTALTCGLIGWTAVTLGALFLAVCAPTLRQNMR